MSDEQTDKWTAVYQVFVTVEFEGPKPVGVIVPRDVDPEFLVEVETMGHRIGENGDICNAEGQVVTVDGPTFRLLDTRRAWALSETAGRQIADAKWEVSL